MIKCGTILCVVGALVLITALGGQTPEISIKKSVASGTGTLVERTYRGKQCIVYEMTKGGKRTRAFQVNGKCVLAETDEDGDGFFESFMVFEPETVNFEWFTREKNGGIIPVSSEKLQEARSKKKAGDDVLSDLITK